MENESDKIIVKTVKNEGADLYCEVRGKGSLLVLIHGGLGDTNSYSKIADILAKDYTVVSYDRRCNGKSTGDKNVDMSVIQQARDTVAIIEAMHIGKATVFGSSAGAIIGLQVIQDYPEFIQQLLVHEAPITAILPTKDYYNYEFPNFVYKEYQTGGFQAALKAFSYDFINGEHEGKDETYQKPTIVKKPSFINSLDTVEFFFAHEYMPLTKFIPNFNEIKKSNVPITVLTGANSEEKYYSRASKILKEKLNCGYAQTPGGHGGYTKHPERFAEIIKAAINPKI